MPVDLPKSGGADEAAPKLESLGWTGVNSDATMQLKMEQSQVNEGVYLALEQDQHWQHASTKFRRGHSIEDPHNQIHVAVGFPMSSIAFVKNSS
jgi:hypothetical protein